MDFTQEQSLINKENSNSEFLIPRGAGLKLTAAACEERV